MTPLTLTPEVRRALYRTDLALFTRAAFGVLNPKTPYLHNWHIDLIASELEACMRGETTRLIINLPPRNLKSICASVAFPAFVLGQNPSAQIICVSYGQELANKHALDTRRVMTSRLYRELFPDTRLADDRWAVPEFTTTARGFRMATSVGGVLTGRGGDMIIIDDPVKPDEALSEVKREAGNTWYHHTLLSRLNQKGTGCIVLIMQRLHEDDLAGHLMALGGWKVVSIPAIAEVATEHPILQLGETRVHYRKPGDLLHPEREPREVLDELRAGLGEYAWAGQYQQSPMPFGGGMVKDAWWGVYLEKPRAFDQIIQSWDTANKVGELNDYSVCTTWGKKGPNIYLLHVYRRRVNYPELKRAVRELNEAFRPSRILIEDRASGTQLIQELRHEGLHAVTGVEPAGDKVMRMNTQSAPIENGFVYLPDAAPWLTDYRAELSAFPKGRHDDQVDSTSQALAYLAKHRPMKISDDLLAQLDAMGPMRRHPF